MDENQLEDNSRYQMADKILFADFKRYYELKELTRNTVVLGQFVELRLWGWLREHVINRLYQGHSLYLGTGTIHASQTGPDRRRQCDIILYEALPDEVEFRQDDLVVVTPDAAWCIIEAKSTVTTRQTLLEALQQIRCLREVVSDALIYLVARESMEADRLKKYIEDLLSREFGIQMLPDVITLIEQQFTMTLQRDQEDIDQATTASTFQPIDLINELHQMSDAAGVPYEEFASRDIEDLDRSGYGQILSSFSERLGVPREVLASMSAKSVTEVFGYGQTVSSFLGKLTEDLENRGNQRRLLSNRIGRTGQ